MVIFHSFLYVYQRVTMASSGLNQAGCIPVVGAQLEPGRWSLGEAAGGADAW